MEVAGDGRSVAPGVDLIATPGHMPGHQSVVISSGAARAVIHEQQLAELEGTDTVTACSHFSEAVFGRILRGDGKRLSQVGRACIHPERTRAPDGRAPSRKDGRTERHASSRRPLVPRSSSGRADTAA